MNLEQCQEARAKRFENETNSASVLQKIGAEFHHYDFRDHDIVRGIMEVSAWHWPAAKAGTRYDQFIICRVFADGGFCLALDANATPIVDMVLQLEAMAKAAETVTKKD